MFQRVFIEVFHKQIIRITFIHPLVLVFLFFFYRLIDTYKMHFVVHTKIDDYKIEVLNTIYKKNYLLDSFL